MIRLKGKIFVYLLHTRGYFMVQTTVIPQTANFDMTILLPENFLGKQVKVLFYISEEVETVVNTVLNKKKPSDFFGILTPTEGEKFENHITKIRNEWDRDI
jgi:hypothetical protein